MRLKKQSMREVADAGALQRQENGAPARHRNERPARPEPPAGMMYFRGALVKRK